MEITNDKLWAAIESGIERVRDRIIEEILLDSGGNDLDSVLDNVQMAMIGAEKEKKIYKSYIFKGEIPEEFIFDPGGEDIIENEEEEDD